MKLEMRVLFLFSAVLVGCQMMNNECCTEASSDEKVCIPHSEVERFKIAIKDGMIESVAGYKFGSPPTREGETDRVIRLDEPIRDFTMIHLGYFQGKLHTISFLGKPWSDNWLSAQVREQEILEKAGFHDWKTTGGISSGLYNSRYLSECDMLSDRRTWQGCSQVIDIAMPRTDNTSSGRSDMLAVVFVDLRVNPTLGEMDENPKREPNCRYKKFFVCNMREIRGLGLPGKYYFRSIYPETYRRRAGVVISKYPGGGSEVDNEYEIKSRFSSHLESLSPAGAGMSCGGSIRCKRLQGVKH